MKACNTTKMLYPTFESMEMPCLASCDVAVPYPATKDVKMNPRITFVRDASSASGASVTFHTAWTDALGIVANVDCVQAGEGDPTPSNIRAITGWAGTTVYHYGEELYERGSLVNGLINSEGEVTTNSSWAYTSRYFPIRPGTYTGTLTKPTSSQPGMTVVLYDANKQFVTRIANIPVTATHIGVNSGAFTVPDGCCYYRLNVAKNATDIHVRKEEQFDITFPTPPGTVYGGTLNIATGVLTITHEGKVFDGTESFAAPGSGVHKYVRTSIGASQYAVSNKAICSHFKQAIANTSNTANGANATTASSTCWITFRWLTDDDTNIDSTSTAWKAYLKDQYDAGTPVTVVYKLTTPVTYNLTPQEVRAFIGENTIFADTGDVSVTYSGEKWG